MKPDKKSQGAAPASPDAEPVVYLEFDDWRAKALADPGEVKDYGIRLSGPPGQAKQADPADPYTLTYVITSEEKDREDDVIHVSGWDWENYFRGGPGPVLFGHDRRSLPVAQCPKIDTVGQALVAVARYPRPEECGYAPDQPFFANTVRSMCLAGFLKSTSVGFLPGEWTFNEENNGFEFFEQEGLEWSVVPIPANPGCFQLARSQGIDLGPLDEWARGALDEIHGRPGVYATRERLELVLRACGLSPDVKIFDLSDAKFRAAVKVGKSAAAGPAKGKRNWGPTPAVPPAPARDLAEELAAHGVDLAALARLSKEAPGAKADQGAEAAAAQTAEGEAAESDGRPAAEASAGDVVAVELADDSPVTLDVDDLAAFRAELKQELRGGLRDVLNRDTATTGQVW